MRSVDSAVRARIVTPEAMNCRGNKEPGLTPAQRALDSLASVFWRVAVEVVEAELIAEEGQAADRSPPSRVQLMRTAGQEARR